MSNKKIRIATRGSDLALWQAHYLSDQLAAQGYESELNIIVTKGDTIQHLSFDKIEGKGFFTKEVEDALINNEADIAVHSMKDLPTEMPEGLVMGGVSYRENPRDCLLVDANRADLQKVLKLPENAVVGTSSSRRKAQLLHLRPDAEVMDLRGNVPTRVRKLKEGQYDAIILAMAGLQRLNLDLEGLIAIPMHHREFVPAPAQGVLAYQCRESDFDTRTLLAKIHNTQVAQCTNVERTVLKMMGGGCHLPLGVYCEQDAAGNYHAFAAMANTVDQPLVKVQVSQTTTDMLAQNLHKLLIERLTENE